MNLFNVYTRLKISSFLKIMQPSQITRAQYKIKIYKIKHKYIFFCILLGCVMQDAIIFIKYI